MIFTQQSRLLSTNIIDTLPSIQLYSQLHTPLFEVTKVLSMFNFVTVRSISCVG